MCDNRISFIERTSEDHVARNQIALVTVPHREPQRPNLRFVGVVTLGYGIEVAGTEVAQRLGAQAIDGAVGASDWEELSIRQKWELYVSI